MIQTGFESRVKIQQIIENQLPEFILDESPKVSEFLKQYYISQEYQGGPVDIAENLDQYLKLDNLTPEVVVGNVNLSNNIDSNETIILVNSTKGFPQQYGLLKIDDEIITYTKSTSNTFIGCIRGFSGITSYHALSNQEELVFSTSKAHSHASGSTVQNLSSLFLKEFYKKLKYTLTPGLEDVDFVSDLNVGNFIRNAKSFYQSKGTDESFRILFNVLFGVTPKIVNLEDFLIKPSSAEYMRRKVVSAEVISGDPSKLIGQTIFKYADSTTNASVSEVEIFTKENVRYYKISLFIGYDERSAIEGNFTITQNTKCLENVSVGASIISVDSTIGFKESGTIVSGNNNISYTNKSINQFFGCTRITEEINCADDIRSDEIYYGYENGDTTKKVEFRITGVLSDFVPVSEYFKVSVGDQASVKSLGELIQDTGSSYKEIFANSWIYNTSSRYEIETFIGSNPKLKSDTNKSSLKVGDLVEIVERYSNIVRYPLTSSTLTRVKSISNDINDIDNYLKTLELDDFSINGWYDDSVEYDLRRKVNKASSSIIPIEYGNDTILSDILNLYNENDDYAYVASNSLPSNNKSLTRPYTYQITTNTKSSVAFQLSDKIDENYYSTINFNTSVPFITGDKIYYQPSSSVISGLETGSYYVEVQSDNKKIKLYEAKSFIGSNSYLTYLNSTFNSENTHKFTLYSQKSETLGPKKILKKFPLNPNIQNGSGELTQPGPVGMLINGVEIQNYKSNDKVYYGPLKSINVLNSGSNYDVINPPLVTISAGLGVTALVQPVLSGSIKSVFVDAQDFDINSIVSIEVTGGNGKGAVLEAILKKRYREIYFDGRLTINSGGINYTNDTLTFLTDHNLNNGDKITYNSNGNNEIGIGTFGGSNNDQNKTLSNNSEYYAKKESNNTIKLYSSFSDYSSGINTVGFTEVYNSGIHKFTTSSNKKTISEIKVINGGEGYKNRKLIVKPVGISTTNHTVNFNNHGFNEGDLITYNYQTSGIVGLSSANQYYISKIDDNSFRLIDAGSDGTYVLNYNRKKYIKFSSTGSGYQYFNYPNILVSITYSRESSSDYSSIIATPSVRGSIVDAYLYENGTGYGSTVLNFHKKPLISIKNGKEAQLKPVIINGTISSVNVQYGGYDYYSVPDLIITDPTNSGIGAELRPIISNGKITSVEITNPGIGYSTSTNILVKASGINALLNVDVRELTVNYNQKFGNELLLGEVDNLQYTVSGYFSTLRNSFNDNGSKHSDIIGWAYDGNPIYGSYGYEDGQNSSSAPKLLKSGYNLNPSNITDRPNGFYNGFFVEDYEYANSGDLDEYNGRFAKTKDFPNGVYAYFSTLENQTLNPSFPYFIGNKYRSNYIIDNSNINQSFDFNNSSLVRNTFPYKISDKYATNDFIVESNEVSNQKSVIDSVTEGSVENFDILNSGSDYKIDDSLEFDNTGTSGGGLIAKVSSLKGNEIVNIDTSTQTYDNVVFSWENEREIKVSIKPYHTLSNRDYITISGLSTNVSKLNGSYEIGVTSYTSSCISSITSITSSGLSTEIYVSQLPPEPISVGSSIVIGNETLKVLEVFENLNILKVQRGSTGVSHTATTQINFLPDSLTLTSNTDYFDSYPTNKVYFNPKESIGVGTNVGITSSITFDFGVSSITRVIPIKGIYIENHPFRDNQKVIFEKPAGTPSFSISTTSNIADEVSFPSSGNSQVVYIINKNKNTIGIKTSINSSEVFFTNINSANDDEYSFISTYDQVIGKVERIKSTVSISTAHNLNNGDLVDLTIKPRLSVGIGTSTSVYIKRNSIYNKILINPLGFNSTGINTTTNIITINSHNLNTGDKIYYSSTDLVASGLSTGSYFVYKIDNNRIKLSETYIDSRIDPPTVVSIAGTGGKYQNISLINPQIKTVKNNNLVFNLSDSSLSGYTFKIYYDQEFKNEFVSTATTTGFTLIGVGTVGVSSTASLTVKYDENLPTKLYYNLEKSGYISTSDKDVNNYSEILFVESQYNNRYTVFGVGTTTFNVTLNEYPEKLSYYQNECDILKYSTNSKSAQGPIDKITIISGGTGYKKLPPLSGSNSENGKDAYIIAKSKTIGYPKEVRIINEGFEYSSDKTLRPDAYISPLITIENSNTISKINILDGGKNYTTAPSIVIVNGETGEKIDSGILEATLFGSSINSVNIIQEPKGLLSTSAKLFSTNNSNGISIQKVESSSSGIFTCAITTPSLGFSTNPFSIGDKVFVEGIQEESNSTGTGFNSKDYGYEFFTVSNYDNSQFLDKVTFNISGLTTNTGTAKIIQDSVASIVKYSDYPKFEVIQKLSYFRIGEKIISNGIERDLIISNYENNFIKVYGTYNLSLGEVIIGKESGNIATISKIEPNIGKFKIDYSVEKNIGWANNIGKLDEDTQVTPDNNYYQNLSYTIKSPIEYENLRTPVNSLLHTSGLKNFADTEIVSNGKSGISSSQYLSIVYDIIEENRVDTIYNFDLVKDIDVSNGSSKFIKLKKKKLTPYIECISNRVLKIDDISKKFSDVDGNPSTFSNIFKIDRSDSYSNLLFRISNIDNTQIQLTELTILVDDNNIFKIQQESIFNSNNNLEYGTFSVYEDEIGENYLQFVPTNPYDYDYDIKLIKSKFNSSIAGIGTESIGFVNLTGAATTSISGMTTSIISIPTYKFESLYANVQIINDSTNQMNFVDVYLNYDGIDNTYISEYYIDSEYSTNNYSGNLIGTFGANISPSGIISLNYTNNSSSTINIRSKIVGFGTTSVGVGTYRFKLPGELDDFEQTAFYESKYLKNVSLASTTLTTLDKFKFNAIKSFVKVSIGQTSALHKILLVQDKQNFYIQQSAFLSVEGVSGIGTLGIGTFGGEYSGNNFEFKFYKDSNINSNINILSFNQCIYTDVNAENIPPNLSYGKIDESFEIIEYNAINGDRINRLDFDLKTGGNPIFAKTFDPTNSSIVNVSSGLFTIPNHFFSNGERLIYTPKATYIGIGESAVGIGSTLNSVGIVTNRLPSEVYVIKISDNTFKLSTRIDYALLGIGVTFTSYGLGNAHQLEMYHKNDKSIISVDNIVQYPLLYTPIKYNLTNNGGQINATSSVFSLSGISSIAPKDILKVDNEYMKVISVGLGTTSIGPITNTGSLSLVEVSRGFVGSSATIHQDTVGVASIYKGSFNIVGSKIFFAEPPRGNPQLNIDRGNLSYETSDFSGRVFLRNDYNTNQIYDDISYKFTGIGKTFTLTNQGINTVGLGSTGGNGIVFINGVFQTPTTDNNPTNNFTIVENSGISSIVFSGIRNPYTGDYVTSKYDVNQNQTPRGGIIVSLGSTLGLGYAPLVGASVTAVLNGGSIISVGLGTTDNLGSGYNGLVSIGVSVYQSGHTGIPAAITASVGAGGTLAFNIVYGGSGYTNPKIIVSPPSYENLEVIGVSRLGLGNTTTTGIGLLLTLDVDSGITSSTGIGSTYFGVSSFKISRQGYSFNRGDVFKPIGLVTDKRLSSPISEFKLTVVDTFSDSFASWQFGEFDYIDSVKNYQDGVRTRFPLYYNSQLLSFEKFENSPIDLNDLLLIVINGVIQDPGVAYQFEGGTSFILTSAPKVEDNIAIFFYRGTKGSDSKLYTNVAETIKKGDTVQILKRNDIIETLSQNKRTVFDLSYSDKFETDLYFDQGGDVDTINFKPMSWTKQKKDSLVNGEVVYKSRNSIESQVYPTAKIIKDFSTSAEEIFVDNAQFFNYENNSIPNIKFDAIIIDSNSVNTVGLVTNFKKEIIKNISNVQGSAGIITGISTTTGIGTALALKFYLNSVGAALSVTTGYPIYIFNTSVGKGVTSIYTSNSTIVGVGTTFLDNIYNVSACSFDINNVGIITCNILSTTSTTGLTTSGSTVGNFSWGRLSEFSRSSSPISIDVTGKRIDVGLTTFSTIQRRGYGLRNNGALLIKDE
jgi:hypothetical protein